MLVYSYTKYTYFITNIYYIEIYLNENILKYHIFNKPICFVFICLMIKYLLKQKPSENLLYK